MGSQQHPKGSAGGVSFDDYVRYRTGALIGLAGLVTRNWADAQDAVQDALVSLYPRWPNLPADELQRYVNRAVVNACLKLQRRQRRSVPVDDIDWLPERVSQSSAESTVLARDLWTRCARLPATQRAALALRFHQDLSFAEIARILGCAEATARSHVHRALATLRALELGEEHHG